MIWFWSLESNACRKTQNQEQRDAAVASAGACAPDGVFRYRLPRCSCLAMAQQSFSKKHSEDGAQKRCSGGPHLRLWARSGGAEQLLVARVYFFRLSNPRTQNPMFFFRKRVTIYFQTSRPRLQAFLWAPFFLGVVKIRNSYALVVS